MISRVIKFDKILRNGSTMRSVSTKVGFIGVGNMGSCMAKNLMKAKMDVTVYDVCPNRCKVLLDAGAKLAPSVKSIAQTCDVIITMLPVTMDVANTLRGPDGVFNNAKPGTLIIDSSTIDPLASKEFHAEAEQLKLKFLDAPTSGGDIGAAACTLTFMVGGKTETLEAYKYIFNGMGKKIFHCGGAGAGHSTKLCNNMALGISMIGACEAMALGNRMGLDPVTLANVINTSTGRSWSSDSYNPVPGVTPNAPASRGYTGGFRAALMEKDLSLAMSAASAIKARVPLGSEAHQLFGLLCEEGYGEKDFSVMYEFLSKTALNKR